MRTITAIVLMLALLGTTASAQESCTTTATNFQKVGSVYSFDIYSQSTGTLLRVGTCSYYLDFNFSALGSPTLTNVNSSFSSADGATNDYGPMTVEINSNKIGVTVHFTGNSTGAGTVLSTSGLGDKMCTVNLTITDAAQTSGLTWDLPNSAVTDSRSNPVANGFSGSDNSPLPITLTSFKALAQSSSSSIRLDWSTASEIDNYGFEVQRSSDKLTGFTTLPGSFQAGHGTTLEAHAYTYVDNTAVASQPWYRLKQSDLNGTVHYSEPVNASTTTGIDQQIAPKVFALYQNYPNPFNPTTMIRFTVENSGPATLVVYNMLGQKVATLFNDIATAGRYQSVRFNATNLASGMYIYRLQSGSKVDVRKLVLTK